MCLLIASDSDKLVGSVISQMRGKILTDSLKHEPRIFLRFLSVKKSSQSDLPSKHGLFNLIADLLFLLLRIEDLKKKKKKDCFRKIHLIKTGIAVIMHLVNHL